MHTYTLHMHTRASLEFESVVSMARNVTRRCSEPYFEKNGHRKWHYFTVWLWLAQTRAARAERHRQESQTCIADLVTLLPHPDAFQTLHKTTGSLPSLKAFLVLQPRLQNELPVHKLWAPKKTLCWLNDNNMLICRRRLSNLQII